MLLLIIIIILIICTSILWNIYFNFFNFQQNYQDLNSYQNSYYGAISSIERWLISSKYMGPWYKWSWGFLWTWYWWNISDNFLLDFWKFTKWDNWLFFAINSKTNKITWKIDYDLIQTIILTLNTWSDYYWTETTIREFFGDESYISWYIKNNFDPISLDTDFQLKWVISLTDWNWHIIPIPINTWNEISNKEINNWASIIFATWIYDIFNSWSIDGAWFRNSGIDYHSIEQALSWWKAILIQFYITWWYLKTTNGIVPYLDFEIESNIEFSDIYYYMTGTSIVWNYKKELFIKKPTSKYKNPNYKNFIFPNYN